MTAKNFQKSTRLQFGLLLAFCLIGVSVTEGQVVNTSAPTNQKTLPWNWVDSDTGFQVRRISNEAGSKAPDSRHTAFTFDQKTMIYSSPLGLHAVEMGTLTERLLVLGPISSYAVATKTRRVFFSRGTDTYLYCADIDSGAVTKVGELPLRAEISSVNSDETLVAGKNVDPGADQYLDFQLRASVAASTRQRLDPTLRYNADAVKEEAMKARAAANIPEQIFVFDLRSSRVQTVLSTTKWIGYAQFSPTDPTLLMYAQEGMYYETDRIWTIRVDGSNNHLIHQRMQKDESATREFWSQDGKTIWYEWQKPRGKSYALVGYDIATERRKLFKLDKDAASISYNVSSGDSLFCGSGHRAVSAKEGANRGSKQSIELLYPIYRNKYGSNAPNVDPNLSSLYDFDDDMGKTYKDGKYVGWFRRVTIANLFRNDYTKLEPNIRFSPDNKWVIFTSNLLGPTYIFAVDITGK